jgi:PleD family two-component response regulator
MKSREENDLRKRNFKEPNHLKVYPLKTQIKSVIEQINDVNKGQNNLDNLTGLYNERLKKEIKK